MTSMFLLIFAIFLLIKNTMSLRPLMVWKDWNCLKMINDDLT